MDKGGVATAFLSVTEPGLWYGDEFEKERQEAISMARDMNEFGARMVSDYKGRFGLFAVLPLPDVEAVVRWIVEAGAQPGAAELRRWLRGQVPEYAPREDAVR